MTQKVYVLCALGFENEMESESVHSTRKKAEERRDFLELRSWVIQEHHIDEPDLDD